MSCGGGGGWYLYREGESNEVRMGYGNGSNVLHESIN